MDKDLLGHSPHGLGIAAGAVLSALLQKLIETDALSRTDVIAILRSADAGLGSIRATYDSVADGRKIIAQMIALFPEDGSHEN